MLGYTFRDGVGILRHDSDQQRESNEHITKHRALAERKKARYSAVSGHFAPTYAPTPRF